jgi:hypothetical protein
MRMGSFVLLLGLLLLIGLVLFGLFWGGSAVAQATLYTEPAPGLWWRAAAGAGAIFLLLLVWSLLNWGAADPANRPFQNVFNFTAAGSKEVAEFYAVRVDEQGNPVGEPEKYTKSKQANGRTFYRDAAGKSWVRADSRGMIAAIEVPEKPDAPRTRFTAPLESYKATVTGPDGKPEQVEKKRLKIDKVRSGMGQESELPLRYTAPDGRYMTSDVIGQVTTERFGLVVANLFLNALHLAVWFAVFFPLLRFQWPHALGLAVAMWFLTSFAVLPVVMQQVPTAAPAKPASSP